MKPAKHLLREESGITLIELLLASAISALLISALTVAIYQFNTLTLMHRASLVLNHQIQSAATLLNRDISSASGGAIAGDTLTLEIREYAFGQAAEPSIHTVSYALQGDSLVRDDGAGAVTVARYVDSVDFGADGELSSTVNVTVLARKDGHSRQVSLAIYRRPADQE